MFTSYFIDNRIFLKIFTFLYRIRLTICFWIDWVRVYKYTKIKGLDSGEVISLPTRKKNWWTWRFISIIAENRQHAHHKTHLDTMKVYNTRPVSLTIEVMLIKIYFFDHWGIHLFQSNQRFQPTCSGKLSSQNMYGAGHAAKPLLWNEF